MSRGQGRALARRAPALLKGGLALGTGVLIGHFFGRLAKKEVTRAITAGLFDIDTKADQAIAYLPERVREEIRSRIDEALHEAGLTRTQVRAFARGADRLDRWGTTQLDAILRDLRIPR